MNNGGKISQRGFIFQSIIAMIECLERDDWDEIKMEPETDQDKVDIILYRDSEILSAMQVKSSTNPFERSDVSRWLSALRNDAKEAERITLYLVGDSFTPGCQEYIKDNPEVNTISFKNLQSICKERLINYIKNAGLIGKVRSDDIELVDNHLFAKIHKNSIHKHPISRAEFEATFRKAMPVHMIPLCLTPIPTINKEVGLIGRNEIKREIRDKLENNGCTALVNGIGGIGKTAVMKHIGNDLMNEGKYVAWIECGGSLQEDLLSLRTALGIPETDKAEDAYIKVINEIRSRLSGKLYLFMDNLSRHLKDDEQEILNGLGIHVMATSRFEHTYFVNTFLDVLDKQSAIDMFYGYYQGDRERRYSSTVWKIIESVHSHTLLIELISKAAWEEGGTLESFYKVLEERGFFDISKEDAGIENAKKELSIEERIIKLYEISELPEIQRHIMRLFTIFTPEKEIFYKVRDWGGLDRQAIRKLVLLGWLAKGGIENGYKIHQIVRDSIAKQIKKNCEDVRLEDYGQLLESVLNTKDYLSETVTYEFVRERIVLPENISEFLWKRWKGIKHRLDSVTNKQWIYNEAALLSNLSTVYYAQGYYRKTEEYCGKALEINESMEEAENLDTAKLYNNMASVLSEQGDYERALKYYKKAMKIEELILGTEHSTFATMYNNIAGVYVKQANYDKALEYFEKAMDICHHLLGAEHPDTAKIYDGMSLAYFNKGSYEKALECCRNALAIFVSELGMEHPDTAMAYNNMAEIVRAQGDYEKALDYHAIALSIRERVLGTEHIDTAMTYNNIAWLLREQHEYEKALDYYKKANKIYTSTVGNNHEYTQSTQFSIKNTKLMEMADLTMKDTKELQDQLNELELSTTYNEAGGIYFDRGDYKNALDYFEKALAINERVLGTEHPDTARIYNNMAGVFSDQGDYEKAMKYYRKALSIRKNVFGTEHPDTAWVYSNMSFTLREQGDYKKSLEYCGKALSIREQVLGIEHIDTAMSYSCMATLFSDMNDSEKALRFYRKALSIRERVLGTEHPDTADTYNNIACVYEDIKDYENALIYFGKALFVRERVLGTEHPDTSDTYNSMADVYSSQGNHELAIKYYTKTLVVHERLFGKEHPKTARIYSNISWELRELGDYEKALAYNEKALSIYKREYGMEHPDTATMYNNMAHIYLAQNRYEKSIECFKIANKAFASVLGVNHPRTRDTMMSILLTELMSGKGI